MIIIINIIGCSAQDAPESRDNSDNNNNNIAERMKILLEGDLSEQTERTEKTTISQTEIISDTLPYEPHIDIIETKETTTIIPETSELPQTESLDPTEISQITKTSETSEAIETTDNKTDLYVITPSGKKYHYPHCRTVKQIKEHLSKEDAERQGYDACKICNPK